ncbi:MAG: NAD(P)H-dependent glycerol-3-phosphate dehydrogenase [Planctomycetota bacterium]|jgi:glycerol-3-phosphate dehydrogenase (NAD(P)+)
MRIGVIGAGAWGTTMAIHLARNGHEVVLWTRDPARAARMQEARENEKYLASISFPDALEATAGEVGACEILAGAVPTQHMRDIFRRLADRLPLAPFISLAKGIEVDTGALPTQIYRQEVGPHPTAVLTGPCIGREVASGLPTAVVIAGDEAEMLQRAFNSDRFRVYTSTDRLGAELSGALKNVLAIAAGIVDGIRLGDNIKAALLTRGIVEQIRLGVALGADAQTFTGLAGFGDLFTTCVSPHSRNRGVGERIGRGERLDDILAGTDSVVEGVPTTRAVLALAGAMGVEMPITAALADVLFRGVSVREALGTLMRRDVRPEYGASS